MAYQRTDSASLGKLCRRSEDSRVLGTAPLIIARQGQTSMEIIAGVKG
jgi:hypothetical protein